MLSIDAVAVEKYLLGCDLHQIRSTEGRECGVVGCGALPVLPTCLLGAHALLKIRLWNQ